MNIHTHRHTLHIHKLCMCVYTYTYTFHRSFSHLTFVTKISFCKTKHRSKGTISTRIYVVASLAVWYFTWNKFENKCMPSYQFWSTPKTVFLSLTVNIIFYLEYDDVNNTPWKIKQFTPDRGTVHSVKTTGITLIPPQKMILSAGILFSGGMPMMM